MEGREDVRKAMEFALAHIGIHTHLPSLLADLGSSVLTRGSRVGHGSGAHLD